MQFSLAEDEYLTCVSDHCSNFSGSFMIRSMAFVSGDLFDDDEGPTTEKAEPDAVPTLEGELALRKRRSDGDEGGGKKERMGRRWSIF
ncbi:hypothetical protein Cni_G09053 [Canna indica]|uniref:Uncharacterized protein n=1 Tax=Canna indica TaxID=4628 RepID=A0AAQ3K1N8_9LILI|nr:hypothetical protein Cni_G09053 [Canna indica]